MGGRRLRRHEGGSGRLVESEGGCIGSREGVGRPLDVVKLGRHRKNEEGHDNNTQ